MPLESKWNLLVSYLQVLASREAAEYAWACDADYLADHPFSLDIYNFTDFGDPNSNVTQAWPSNLADCVDNPVLANLTWSGLCERMGGYWLRPLIHFDNVPYGYLALFQVATFEGWMEVMEASIDAPLLVS